MEVVQDEVVDFWVDKFKSKAGKDVAVQKMTLKEFGPVSLGWTKPETLPFIEGDTVVINVEKNYGQYEYKGEAPIGTTPTLSKPAAKAAPRSGGGGKPGFAMVPKVFPVPPTHGDMAIIHQNSLTNARALVETTDYQGLMEQGKGSGITTKDVEDEIIRLAYRFADFSSGADLRENSE
jgi:hypothetical protein